jgi:hypothetical protein
MATAGQPPKRDDEAVRGSLLAVAGAVGSDLAYFAPPEERHFDPISVGIAFGGLLIISYLKGVRAEAEQDAEALGRETVKWFRGRVRRLFDREHAASADDEAASAVAEVRQAAAEAEAALAPLDFDLLRRRAEATRRALEEELARTWGLSTARAAQLAAQVEKESWALLPGGAGVGEVQPPA